MRYSVVASQFASVDTIQMRWVTTFDKNFLGSAPAELANGFPGLLALGLALLVSLKALFM